MTAWAKRVSCATGAGEDVICLAYVGAEMDQSYRDD
jgi:hypothetical protein